jgi:sigma-54 dependent transcriptional regulator, acetoin dehydrogenase operon transcriptional activator AcoR
VAQVRVDAARRRFLRHGADAVGTGVVRPEVVASWERAAGVDTARLGAAFTGLDGPAPARVAAAERVLDAVHGRHPDLTASVLVVDRDGVVRARRDADPALAEILDAVCLAPGYRHAEDVVGTTAAALALHEGRALVVEGPEHLHPELAVLAAAAAPVGRDGEPADLALVLVRHAVEGAARDLPLARVLAGEVVDRDGADRRERVLAVHEALAATATVAPWAVATDGEDVLLGPGARRLPPADQQALADLALAGLALEHPAEPYVVDLPSGGAAEVAVREVRHGERVVGCAVGAGPAVDDQGRREAEARRRQGSHVAPTARRDFAAALRGDAGDREHAEARVRANRDLLTPSLRARQELAAHLAGRRHQVLVGEAGVGKRTMAVQAFGRLHGDGGVTVVDVDTGDTTDDGARAAEPLARLVARPPNRPYLVVLRGLQAVAPLAARRLDEALRLLLARAGGVVVVACLDTTAVDAGRPYGLLLRHFHETVRVPALRHRTDELADLALSVLRSLSGGRSLRLSHQVIRVLEGYAWPGNINELEDVLRYVVARKPVGVVQAPDLPALCFASRAPRLTMLETAQADAIIQALYEARGNRYQAAAMLGIARSSLYRKIDAFGISYIA